MKRIEANFRISGGGWRDCIKGVGQKILKRGEYETALADFSSAVELQPEDEASYLGLGQTQYYLKDYQAALVSFDRVIELQPGKGDNFYWRGQVYQEQGDYAAALADFDRAIELQPQDGYNYFWRGILHQQLNILDAAQADWKQATSFAEMETDVCDQRRLLARLTLLKGHPDSAHEHYLQALNGTCKYYDLRTELSHLHLLSGMFPARDDIRAMAEWFAAQLEGRA